MKNIGVIGIGNPLRRDDGIGIILLEKLIEKKNELPDNIEYIDGGTGGMNLLHVLARFDTVILIDAVNFDGIAGESKLFTSGEVYSKKITINSSTHGSDFIKILKISKDIGESPEEIFIFGIQPKDISHGFDLSIELKQVVESLLIKIQDKIKVIAKEN